MSNLNIVLDIKADSTIRMVENLNKALGQLRVSKDLKKDFADLGKETIKSHEKIKKMLDEGIKTPRGFKEYESHMAQLLSGLDKISKKWGELENLPFDGGIFKETYDEILAIQEQMKGLGLETERVKKALDNIDGIKGLAKDSKTMKNLLQLQEDMRKAGESGVIAAEDIEVFLIKLEQLEKTTNSFKGKAETPFELKTESQQNWTRIAEVIQGIKNVLGETGAEATELQARIDELLNIDQNHLSKMIRELAEDLNEAATEAEKTQGAVKNFASEQKQIEELSDRVERFAQRFLGLAGSVTLLRKVVRDAFGTIKELDEAMTGTAVVTDYSIGDMWAELPRYTKMAKEHGATIRGAYEVNTLYYQQGLNTNEVFAVGTETLKMARIAGLDYARTTDLMTSALRGFNMEISETSAQRINDVYSQLAAKSAANTEEIANAMTKTASIANSANMEFETTAAFLTTMIETTREASENLGTAMKTVIARFTEMKKDPMSLVEVDGEVVDANRIETALRSVGIELRDVTGEFRDLDEVFLEIADKWDGMTNMQQRYVATMAAGSRQQSRFIAMVSNHARTMELLEYATDSAGASNEQFNKTLDSMEAKLNGLRSNWENFAVGLIPASGVKATIDSFSGLLEIINRLTDSLGFFGSAMKIALAAGGLFGGGRAAEGLVKKISAAMSGADKGTYSSATQGLWNQLFFSNEQRKALMRGTEEVTKDMYGTVIKKSSEAGLSAGKAFFASLGPFAWIAAGILIASIGKIIYDKYMNHKKLAKEAREKAEELDLESKGMREEVERLNDSRDVFDGYTDTLSSLVQGTQEWNEVLGKSNDHVLGLIEKFPEVAKYVSIGKDGRLDVESGGWAEAKKAMEDAIAEMDRSSLEQRALALREDYKELMSRNTMSLTRYTVETPNKFTSMGVTGKEFLQAHMAGTLDDLAQQRGTTAEKLRVLFADVFREYELYLKKSSVVAIEVLNTLKKTNPEFAKISNGLASYIQDALVIGVEKGILEISPESLESAALAIQASFKGFSETLFDPKNWSMTELESFEKSSSEFQDLLQFLRDMSEDEVYGTFYAALLERLEADFSQLQTNRENFRTQLKAIINRTGSFSSDSLTAATQEALLSALGKARLEGGAGKADELAQFLERASNRKGFEKILTGINSLDFTNAKDIEDFQRLLRSINYPLDESNKFIKLLKDIGFTMNQVPDALSKQRTQLGEARKVAIEGGLYDEENYRTLIAAFPDLEDSFVIGIDGAYRYLGAAKSLVDKVDNALSENANALIADTDTKIENLKRLEASEVGDKIDAVVELFENANSWADISAQDVADIFGENALKLNTIPELLSNLLSEAFDIPPEDIQASTTDLIHQMITQVLDAGTMEGLMAERARQEGLIAASQVPKGDYDRLQVAQGDGAISPAAVMSLLAESEAYEATQPIRDKYLRDLEAINRAQESGVASRIKAAEETAKLTLKELSFSNELARTSKAFEDTRKTVQNILKEIKGLDRTSAIFQNKMLDLASVMSEMFDGVELPSDFFDSENLELLSQAIEGSEDSWYQLADAMRLAAFHATEFGQEYAAMGDDVFGVTEALDGLVFEIDGRADVTDLVDKLLAAGMTAEQVGDYLESLGLIGVDFKVETQIIEVVDYINPRTGAESYKKVEVPKRISGQVFGFDKFHAAAPNFTGAPRGGSRSGGGGGGGGGGKAEKDWLNPYDRFYNLLEQISEAERQRVKLQQEYNRELENGELNIAKVLDLRKQEITNLYEQKRLQEELLKGRRTQLAKIAAEYHTEGEVSKSFSSWGVTQYGRYDKQAGVVVIDWSGLEKIKDTELGGAAQAYISRLEELSSEIEGIEDAIEALHDDIKATLEKHRDDYLTLEQQLLEGLIKQQQRVIDNLSDLHDAITNSQQEMISTMQEQIDLQRQIRDNTKIEEDIAEKEARLQYLRQDPSGGNQLEIMRLEKEIDQARQDHSDNLIDQHMNELQRQNDRAAEQRALQIEIAQAHLDHMTASGAFWPEIETTLKSALNGEIWAIDRIRDIMMVKDDVDAMSTFGTKDWERKWTTQVESALAGLQSWAKDEEEWRKAAAKAVSTSSKTTATPAKQEITTSTTQSSSSASGPGLSPSNKSGNQETKTTTTTVIKTLYEHRKTQTPVMFSGGGYTGDWFGNEGRMAMLHKKELVFDATDSANLIELKDTLRGLKRSSSNSFGDSPLNQYFEIFIDAAIASDYDAARLGEQLQQKFQDYGAYRNVPVLGKLR